MSVSFGCDQTFIDEIQAVDPGPDMAAPVVNVSFPLQGTLIRVVEDVTPINISFEATDDIELKDIVVRLDGNEIARFDEFMDFRRFLTTYTYNNLTNGSHTLEVSATDMAGKSTSKSVLFEKAEPYRPVYDGEIFYLPFDGDFTELMSIKSPTVSGSPSFVDGVSGKAYAGANNAYLTFPTAGLLGSQFSAVFWYKVNGTPDRAGILTIGPPDPLRPTSMNNRTSGFRLFRENAGGKQRFKLNVGNGSADNWFDGGAAADIDPAAGTWAHIAFTISNSQCTVYINGQVVSQGNFPGVSWTGCDILTVASGTPRFVEWGHLSTQSLMDEMRLFNKALSQSEIQAIIDAEKP